MNTLNSGRRQRLSATLLSGLLLGMGFLFSGSAMAQIAGTAHDFSDGLSTGPLDETIWNTTGEICVVCHTPHNAANAAAEAGPLWNRTLTVATYNVYEGANVGSDLDGGPFIAPSGISRLCLSCHDGTIAVDSFGGAQGQVGTNTIIDIRASANIGEAQAGVGDMTNDHPVSFEIPTIVQDPEIFQPTAGFLGVVPFFGASERVLECASCHDVHGTGFDYLLRVDNDNSDLCLTCHDK